ncbi:MAG: metallophosphoesterase [Planctomycetes bacterium]|nr:metallophosphoesterase [Planctomycetota bacterium]
MFKEKLLVLLLVLCVALPGCSGSVMPERVGQWRVEVGPPGNEFYKAPEKGPPPSEAVLRWARIFAPHAKVTKWKLENNGYQIDSETGNEEYKFYVTPEGKLLGFKYENNATGVEEQADELVLRGTKKSIAVSAVPNAALETLARAMPNAKPSKAWTADTIVGKRYVILVGKTAFYARPDGQIRTGGLVSIGALDEIDPADRQKDKTSDSDPKKFSAELEALLGQYRQRFNFTNQIKRLGRRPKNADGSFRYVVMGDSRSQWDLWSNIVKHIDGLEPKPAFVINTGDVVPKGYAREYSRYYVPPLLKTDIPFLIAIGNHDDGSDSMAQEYRYLFGAKALNYYFDYGKARHVFIDNVTKVQPYGQTLKWLDETLADTPEGYRKYVFAHKPPSTIEKWAYHAWDDSNSRTFTGLMTKHEVDEVYHGHIHAYSTATFGGINYTLTGGGGAGLHNRYGPLGNVHHYIICDVMADGTVKQQVVRFYKTAKILFR